MQKHQSPKVAGSVAFVAKSRKSVPFNYSFRSDCKVRELVNGFQSELIEDTLGKNKRSSGFEIKSCLLSIIDTPSVGSSSKKASCQTSLGLASTPAETRNDPSIYFHFDNTEDINTSVVKKKRTYSCTGPLSISPSQKKSKCQPANVSENPCSTVVPSSIVAADPKVRFSEERRTNGNTLPPLSTGNSDVPHSDITPASNINNPSVLSSSIPAAAVTNISTLIGYAPALGDGDIIRAVRDHNKNQVDWAHLDKKMKKPEGYSRDRYFNVLRKYATYDVTITRAVLSAQVKNQPVQWTLLDQQYTLGRAEARWNQVLRAHCDMKGVTVNGILRPELHSQYRHTTGPANSTIGGTVYTDVATNTALNTSANTNRSAVATNTAVNTNINTNISILAIRSAMTQTVSSGLTFSRVSPMPNSSDNLHNAAPELYNVRPFTVAEDQQLRSSIDYVLKKKMPIELSWTTIGRFLNRSVASLKARWKDLIAAENHTLQQAQAQLHSNGIIDWTQGVSYMNAPCNSGTFGLQVPPQRLNQRNVPAVTNLSAVPPQHYRCSTISTVSTPNDSPYSGAEDDLIRTRIPMYIQTPDVNLYNRFLQLSCELNRPLASVQQRWQVLSQMSMTNVVNTYHGNFTECAYVGGSASYAARTVTVIPSQSDIAVNLSSGVNQINALPAQPSLLNNAYHRSLITKPPEQILPSIAFASKSMPLPAEFSTAPGTTFTPAIHEKPAVPALSKNINSVSIASKPTTAIATPSPTPAKPVSLPISASSIGGLLSRPCLLKNTTNQSVFAISEHTDSSAVEPLPSIHLASKAQAVPVSFSRILVSLAVTAPTATTAATATSATASATASTVLSVAVNTGLTSPDARPVNPTSLVVPVAQPSTIATSIADSPLAIENNLAMDNRVDINSVEPGKSSRIEPIDQRIELFTPAEDKCILAKVPLSLHQSGDLEERFAQLSRELNRTVTTIAQRWFHLFNAARTKHGRSSLLSSASRMVATCAATDDAANATNTKNTAGVRLSSVNVPMDSESSVVPSVPSQTHTNSNAPDAKNVVTTIRFISPVENASIQQSVDLSDNTASDIRHASRKADSVNIGGEKLVVEKPTEIIVTSASVSTAYSTSIGRSLNNVNATQSAHQAGYGTLNLVRKPLQTQDASADVQVPIPAKGRSNHTVEDKVYSAAEDTRIAEVVMSVLQNSSKTNNAWEKLATELGKDVLSLKNRWLQIFKSKRHLDRNTCGTGFAELLKTKACIPPTSNAENGDSIIIAMPAHLMALSPGNTDCADITHPSPQTGFGKDCSNTIGESCGAMVISPAIPLDATKSQTSGKTEGCTMKLALSPLQLDRAESHNRAVVFPSRENLHDAYVDSEGCEYW